MKRLLLYFLLAATAIAQRPQVSDIKVTPTSTTAGTILWPTTTLLPGGFSLRFNGSLLDKNGSAGTSGQVPVSDGTNITWTTVSGVGSGTGTVTSITLTPFTGITVNGTTSATITTSGTFTLGTALTGAIWGTGSNFTTNANLTGIGNLTAVANRFPYLDVSNAWALAPVTAFARSILDDTDGPTVRATIGAGIGDAILSAANTFTYASESAIKLKPSSSMGDGSRAFDIQLTTSGDHSVFNVDGQGRFSSGLEYNLGTQSFAPWTFGSDPDSTFQSASFRLYWDAPAELLQFDQGDPGNAFLSLKAATYIGTNFASQIPNLGTATQTGVSVLNTTAAAAGAQQVSPSVQWGGYGWKTNSTAASQRVDFQSYVLPVQGAANPSGIWKLQSSINGGGWTDRLSVTSSGTVTATSFVGDGSGLTGLPGGTIQVGNTVFVSKDGNDGTGLRERLDKPFLTIGAALTAAASGDAVEVLAGTYNEQIQLKAGVVINLPTAASIIDYTGQGPTFLQPASAAEIHITGNGVLRKSGANAVEQHVFKITNASEIYVDGSTETECAPSSVKTDHENFSTIYASAGYIKIKTGELKGTNCSTLHRVDGGEVELVFDVNTTSGAGVTGSYLGATTSFGRVWWNGIRMVCDPAERAIFTEGSQSSSTDLYINVAAIFGCLDFTVSAGLIEVYGKTQLLIPSYEGGSIGSSDGRPVFKCDMNFADSLSGVLVMNYTIDAVVSAGNDPTVFIRNGWYAQNLRIGAINCEDGIALEMSDGDVDGNTGTIPSPHSIPLNIGVIQGNGDSFIKYRCGKFRLIDTRILYGGFFNCIDVADDDSSGNQLELVGCTIHSSASQPSIQADGSARTVYATGSFGNVAKDSDVTIVPSGGLLIDSNVR